MDDDDHSHLMEIAAIRSLLRDAFEDVELRRLCQDEPALRPVLSHFGPRFSFEDMIEAVVTYCGKRELWPELLAAVEKVNPRQYERYRGRLGTVAGTGTFFEVPFMRNPDFVGRQEDLERLHSALRGLASASGERAVGIRPAGLTGLGGIGKTQLAVEYAYRYRAAYPGGVFWVNAAEPLADGLAQVGRRVRPGTIGLSLDEQVQAVAGYLQAHADALLVLDNLADPVDLNRPLVGGLVPAALPCRLLFTTRRRDVGRFQGMELSVLPEEPALELLLRHESRRPALDPAHTEHGQARAICALLGCLPLALEIAGAHMGRRPDAALAAYYQELLVRGALPVLDDPRAALRADDLPTRHEAALVATLAGQWAGLGAEARLTLRVAGQLPEAAQVPASRLALLAGLEERAEGFFGSPLDAALRELGDASLVEELRAGQLRLHPLVREFAARQTPSGERSVFRLRCVGSLVGAYEDMARLEDECTRRGVDAAEADLAAALELLRSAAPEAVASGGAEMGGRWEVEKRLRGLLRVVQRECHVLQGWNRAAAPGLLAQRVHYRAMALGLGDVATRAAARLEALSGSWLALRWLVGPETMGLERTLAGHSGGVTAVATLGPDGQRAVSGSWDGTLKVWNLATGREERTLAGHGGWVTAVAAVGIDGRQAISGSADGTLKVWDLVTGQEERTLVGHRGQVTTVAAFGPEGRRVISGSADGALKVWDLATGQEECTLAGHSRGVHAVAALGLDGQRAISGSDDGTLKVWNLATGREERTLEGHGWRVTTVAGIGPDGWQAISGSDDGTLKVWNLATGEEECTMEGHTGRVLTVAVLGPDGRRVISGSDDGTLKVWNLATGREERTLVGHNERVHAVATIGSDGRRAISGSDDGTLKVWDISPPLDAGPSSRWEQRMLAGHSGRVYAVAVIGLDGRRAVSGSDDGTLKVWDISPSLGADLATRREERTLTGHSGRVTAVAALGLDGRRAISGSGDKTLKVWDLETGREERTLVGHRDVVRAVVTIGLSEWLVVSGSDDGTLKVWNLATGREERTLYGHSGRVTAVVAIGLDGRRAISTSWDGTLKVWDMATGREERTLEGHSGGVTAVATLGPEERRAISGSSDGMLKVWDLATGQEERTLVGHGGRVAAVAALGPAGRRAISGSDDGTLRVWNLAAGREMASLAVEAGVTCVATGPGGTIVAGDKVGNVYCLELRGCQPISGTD